jgi:hypothetical protein
MNITRTTSLFAVLASAALLATGPVSAHAEAGPPGDIPDNQAFVKFHGAGYSLKVPEGWPRTQKAFSVTFSDKYNSIRVDISKASSRPTVSSVTKIDLAKLRATVKGFAQPKVTAVKRRAGTAILVTYRATSPPNAVTGKSITNDVERYAFWRGGKLAVLTLQAPKGSDNVDPWKLVTDSFAWVR